MKKTFITLGALAIMLAFSPQELNAKTPSALINASYITQETTGESLEYTVSSDPEYKLYTAFRSIIYSILINDFEIASEDITNEVTFAQLGMDSLDWIEFNVKVGETLGFSPCTLNELYNGRVIAYVSINYRLWMKQ